MASYLENTHTDFASATNFRSINFRNTPSMLCYNLQTIFVIILLIITCPQGCQGGTYSQQKAIYDKFLSSSVYNPNIRPLRDQNQIMYILAGFEIVSIVEISDVYQSFHCNGFLPFTWRDEMVQWNESDYGGVKIIAPETKSIFRPRVVLLNTMGDRDLFEDDAAPTSIKSTGETLWIPGSIFPASCKLSLHKYPFDQQTCTIKMAVMSYEEDQLLFIPTQSTAGFSFYTENGEWDIVNSSITTPVVVVQELTVPSVEISFTVKRKPAFLMISVILPVIFLSLLNLLVFVIPVESGEKISYGITVLLALSVFMSIMSAMLPRSSESMPLVIIYIFVLLAISVLTVVASIIIVKLHHMEEKMEQLQRAQQQYKKAIPRVTMLRRAVTEMKNGGKVAHMGNGKRSPVTQMNVEEGQIQYQERGSSFGSTASSTASWSFAEAPAKVNKYKVIGIYIDMVSFAVFGLVWAGTTLGFMLAIAL